MTANNHALAQQILSVIDLTSLNDNDTDDVIKQLCQQAITPYGNVAAVCVYPKFVKLAKKLLQNQFIEIATVSNFPQGNSALDDVKKEIQQSLADGADEIDVVLPYQLYLAGKHKVCQEFISTCKKLCGDKTLKVILETGALKEPDIIAQASTDVIAAGADFLKTSTGKIAIGATPEAARIMLNAIHASKRNVGFKASGGVRTLVQAMEYLQLAQTIMGDDWPTAKHFRLGASSLLQDVLSHLKM